MIERKCLVYQFDNVRIDLNTFEVFKGDSAVRLEPKAFEALVFLIENRGRLIQKREILDAVWKDAFVTENAMTRVIAQLRKALGDGSKQAKYIETVPTRGYRFIANVRVAEISGTDPIAQEQIKSQILISQQEGTGTTQYSEAEQRVPTGGGWASLSAKWKMSIVACALLTVTLSAFLLWMNKPVPSASDANPKPVAPNAVVKSIAVLPFKPLVADSRNESLELGMADTLINKLSPIRQLVVRPISEVRRYTSLEQDPIAAGRELGVDYVLEGNLQMFGEKTRTTVRLLSVKDGSTLWTDKCDQTCNSVFELQDAIAERIAGVLALELTNEEKKHLSKRYTENTEAYQLYIRGRYHLNRRIGNDLNKCISYFEQAINKDPGYALAYAGLADSYSELKNSRTGLLSPKEAMPKVKAAAEQALRLDDTLAEVHISLAEIKGTYEWNWPGAEMEYRRAIALNPNLVDAHIQYGIFLSYMGRHDESIAELKQALEIEPLDPRANIDLGYRFYIGRRYDEAVEQFRKTADLGPNPAMLHCGFGWAYEQKGMYEEAIAEYFKAISVAGNDTSILSYLGIAYAGAGKRDDAQKVIAKLKDRSQKHYVSAYLIASCYAGLGEKEQTLAWLEKAYEERDDWIVWIKVYPVFDSLRSDPRFIDLMRRVGLVS